MKKLPRSFFTNSALVVATEILGKHIVHVDSGIKLSGKIVETESYTGPEDKASHSYNWKETQRNRVEYLIGGHIYIYLVYGMYWQLNITTAKKGMPECVLIRAVEPVDGIKKMMKRRKTEKLLNLTNGPGKFCQAFGFNKTHYGTDVTRSSYVYLQDSGEKLSENDIVQAKRIGIDYAGEWAEKPWRFYIKNNLFVSRK